MKLKSNAKYDYTVTLTYTKKVRAASDKEAKEMVLKNHPKRPVVSVSMPTRKLSNGAIVTRGPLRPIKLKK